jgi:ferritin
MPRLLSDTLRAALNEQIKDELYAAYLYLAMVGYFKELNLDGFAHWYDLQRQEEIGHGLKIFEYVYDRDAKVELKALSAPPSSFQSPLDVAQQAFDHERAVTEKINDLYELATSEKDYQTQALLQWFLSEQVEEEKSALQVVERLKMAGNETAALFMLDREMGARSTAA